MELVIKDVPDDKAVITEILANAETTIRNFHDKQIRVVSPEKEVEFATAVESFKTANKISLVADVEPIKEEVINDIPRSNPDIKPSGIADEGIAAGSGLDA